MSSTCIVLRAIENVAQDVADFLTNTILTNTDIQFIIGQLESLKGSVRSLPINTVRKGDILNRITEAETIIQNLTLDPLERLQLVLQLLDLVALKVGNLCIPCTQGLSVILPSNTFSTSCCFCR